MTKHNKIDTYYRQAKHEGFIARSVYKLIEMDKRYQLLHHGQKVLDLGAHPGSWFTYICNRVGPSGLIVGVDIKPLIVSQPSWGHFFQADILNITTKDLKIFSPFYDVILSDVAPCTTGITHTDIAQSQKLTTQVIELALTLLKPGGALIAKVYRGANLNKLLNQITTTFTLGKAHKPKASLPRSKEIYILGQGFKPLSFSAK